jgi:hypothetical protein
MRTPAAFIVSVGLGAIFLPACELGQADVVVREPASPKADGGDGRQDTAVATTPSVDAAEALDTVETPEATTGGADATEAGAGDGEGLSLFDSADSPLPDGADAGQPGRDLGQQIDACSSDALAFCDDVGVSVP